MHLVLCATEMVKKNQIQMQTIILPGQDSFYIP